jgi:hypothetical protein
MFITFGTALIILKLLPKFQAPVFIFWLAMFATDRHTDTFYYWYMD